MKRNILIVQPFVQYPIDNGAKQLYLPYYQILSKHFNIVSIYLDDKNIIQKNPYVIMETVYKSVFVDTVNKFGIISKLHHRRIREIIERLNIEYRFIAGFLMEAHLGNLFNGFDFYKIYNKESPLSNYERSFKDYRNLPIKTYFGNIMRFMFHRYYFTQKVFNVNDLILFRMYNNEMYYKNKGYSWKRAINVEFCLDVNKYPDHVMFMSHKISFSGYLNYSPNKHAVYFILDNIWEQIIEWKNDCKLFIYGSNPDDYIKSFDKVKNIEIKGYVENLYDEIKDSQIVLAPIFQGVGTKTKIVESMLIGKCVITNRMNIENMKPGLIDGINIIFAENASEFVRKIKYYIDRPEMCMNIGIRARNYMIANYNFNFELSKIESLSKFILEGSL